MGDNSTTKPSKDIIAERYAKGLKTYIITLKFPDISLVDQESITRIGYGGDVWEFRVDLLACPSQMQQKQGIPSPQFVKSQLQTLKRISDLPILFTVRTVSQGGTFPNDAEQEALQLMELAVDLGCEYIDVEISWSAFLIEKIRARKGNSKIVASHHEFDASVKWTSKEWEGKCSDAEALGDITKLCLQAADINDSLELGLYVRDYRMRTEKPIIAVAMGPHGQLSRFTAPITFVTHELIPQPPGSDQLTLKDINLALCLLGQLPRRKFYLSGSHDRCREFSSLLRPAFQELGLPYSFFDGDEKLEVVNGRPDFGGVCFLGEEVDLRELAGEQFELWTGRKPPWLIMDSGKILQV